MVNNGIYDVLMICYSNIVIAVTVILGVVVTRTTEGFRAGNILTGNVPTL